MKSTQALMVALVVFGSTAALAAGSIHTRIFTGSGTFTFPANTKPGTEFQFTVIGGGGGAGGCHSTGYTSGGGSGGAGFASFSGFNPSDTMTITVGTGGTGGNSSGSNGGSGGTSKLTYAGIDIAASTGGNGSMGATGGSTTAPGSAGMFSATAGTTSLTLQSSLDYAAEEGVAVLALSVDAATVPGGGNPIGHSGTITNQRGALGGGGLGCFFNLFNFTSVGGAGGTGVVIISWTA